MKKAKTVKETKVKPIKKNGGNTNAYSQLNDKITRIAGSSELEMTRAGKVAHQGSRARQLRELGVSQLHENHPF
jgi:hypothetical protein